jgi:hypothetical protein
MIVLPRQARDKHAPRETALKNRDRFRRLLNAAYDMWTAHPDVRAQRNSRRVFCVGTVTITETRHQRHITNKRDTSQKQAFRFQAGCHCQDRFLRLELPRQASQARIIIAKTGFSGFNCQDRLLRLELPRQASQAGIIIAKTSSSE